MHSFFISSAFHVYGREASPLLARAILIDKYVPKNTVYVNHLVRYICIPAHSTVLHVTGSDVKQSW